MFQMFLEDWTSIVWEILSVCCFFSSSELVGVRAVTLLLQKIWCACTLLDPTRCYSICVFCTLSNVAAVARWSHSTFAKHHTQKIQYGECNSVTHNTQRFMGFPLACTREHPQQCFDDASGPAFLKGSSAKSRQLGQKLGCMLAIDHGDCSTKWVERAPCICA